MSNSKETGRVISSKMNTSGQQDPDPKRMLKSILELGRQLDYATSKCDSIESLFAPELQLRRTKMKKMCVELLLQLHSEYSLQVRERLWRSVCYDVMCRAKRLKKDNIWSQGQFWFLRNHLISGIGHISYLLLQVQELSKFKKLSLRYYDSEILSIYPQTECIQVLDGSNTEEKWLQELLYYCLLNIGDLYRYLTDIYASSDEELYWNYHKLAEDYYTKAFFLNTDYGMAHNQLGNLNLKVNNGLDSTYYLLHSMTSPIAYEGSYSNLRQLLQRYFLSTLSAPIEWKPLEAFTYSFLAVIRQFLYETTRINNFEKMCQDTLMSFSEVLTNGDPDLDSKLFFRVSLITIMTVWHLQSIGSPNVSTAVALAMGVFFQIAHRLLSVLNAHSHVAPPPQKSPSSVVELHECFKSEITLLPLSEGEAKIDKEVQSAESLSICNGQDDSANGEELTVSVKSRNKSLFRRRRRLRRTLSSGGGGICYSSDEDDGGSSTPSYRFGEGKVLGSSDGENSRMDYTDDSDYGDEEYWTEGDSDSDRNSFTEKPKSPVLQTEEQQPAFDDSTSSNGLSDSPSIDTQKTVGEMSREFDQMKWNTNGQEDALTFIMDSEELMQCWTHAEPLLVALLPFVRWLQTSPAVSDAFASNCETVFLVKLCKIMNLLKSINWDKPYVDILGETNKVTESFRTEWDLLLNRNGESEVERQQQFSYELPEDRSMLGLQQFKSSLSSLKRNSELLKGELMMTRIARMLIFGNWLAETESFAVLYSTQDNRFLVPTPADLRRHIKSLKLDQLRNKLQGGNCKELEKLTQLWKNSNPNFKGKNDLARNNRGGYRPRITRKDDAFIFVFVDLPAVLNHFKVIRHLATHPKFVLVLPHSVSKTLDILKESEEEGSQEARIASRWMERAGSKGYNEVRSQREHEKTRINTTYPEDFTADSWEFFDVLESCNFLRTQELKGAGRPPEKFFGDVRDKYRILYLSGHNKLWQPSSEIDFNPIEAAKVTNVFVDKITTYSSRRGRRRRARNIKSNG